MSPDKDKALCEKYPTLTGDRHGDMRYTAMCWGFSCGDGWYDILDKMCGQIVAVLKRLDAERGVPEGGTHGTKQPKASAYSEFRFTQVKQKFGTLRVYTNYHLDEISKIINEAEHASATTCEDCGKPGVMRGPGYIFVGCEEHANGSVPLSDLEDDEEDSEDAG